MIAIARRPLLAVLAAAGLGPWGVAARAGTPLRLIVPQAPGGAADSIARLVGDGVSRWLGRPVLIDNRPGGGTVSATLAVVQAVPDGNTIAMVLSALAINQALRRRMPYQALEDFEPVGLGGYSLTALVARTDLLADDIAGLIALARRSDPPLQYATPGLGSATHLAGELFNARAGVETVHVPYNGSAQLYNDMSAGRIALAYVTLESALPHLAAGRLKVLGLTNALRSDRYPQYPTIAETLPGFEMLGFFGFVAPARTPPEVVAVLYDAIQHALRAPAASARLADLGVVVSVAPPASFAVFLREQVRKYRELGRRARLQLD